MTAPPARSPRPARRRRPAALLLALAALLALPGCRSTPPVAADAPTAVDPALRELLPPSVRARGTLRIGTDAAYPPANSFASDGRTIVGFEPDLAGAVGRVLGVRAELVVTPFDQLLPAVAGSRLDLAMAAITDTAERERSVDFVDYFTAGTSVVVRRGNPEGILDLNGLCGQTVAVEKATVHVDLLGRLQSRCQGSRIVVKTYENNAKALLQLRTGRAAAVLNDYPPAVALVNEPRTRAYFQLAADTQYEPGLYGVAVSKSAPLLRDAVAGALERVMRSGEYRRILTAHGVEQGAVPRALVNAAQAG